jgi:hypothetical protein
MRDPKIPPPAAEETELVAVTEPIDDDDARMISTTDPAYWQLGALLKWFMKQPIMCCSRSRRREALSVEPDDEPDPAA